MSSARKEWTVLSGIVLTEIKKKKREKKEEGKDGKEEEEETEEKEEKEEEEIFEEMKKSMRVVALGGGAKCVDSSHSRSEERGNILFDSHAEVSIPLFFFFLFSSLSSNSFFQSHEKLHRFSLGEHFFAIFMLKSKNFVNQKRKKVKRRKAMGEKRKKRDRFSRKMKIHSSFD